MAKESMKAREVKRAKLVAKYAAKRQALKELIHLYVTKSNLCTDRHASTELEVRDILS